MKKTLGSLLFLAAAYTLVAQKISRPSIQWTVDWSPDDKLIAVGGDDSVVRIFTPELRLQKSFAVPYAIRRVEWHPDGKTLAVTGNEIRLINLETGDFLPVRARDGARAVSWNSSGELLAVASGRGVVSVWDKNGQLVKSIPRDTKSFLCIAWHPFKNIVVTGSDEIRIIDVTIGMQVKEIHHRTEHTGVLAVQWHPSGEFFAIGDYGHAQDGIPTILQFWNENGTFRKEMLGSMAEYRNISWSKDGKFLATASDALRIWSREGELLFRGPSDLNDLLWGVDWSSDGRQIVTTSAKGKVRIWDAKGRLVRTAAD